jgi:CDP-glycerol glycerophosphotransferase
LEEYKDSLRGFYFDFLGEAPGPIVITNEHLVKEIEDFDFKVYQDKYDAFQRKYNHADHGDAAKQVVDLIQQRSGIQQQV